MSLILRGIHWCPGRFGASEVSGKELVSLVDLPPTLLGAAGLPVPGEMQGRSLLPLLRGERAGWPEEVFVQISESQVGRAVRTRRWKYGVDAPGRSGRDDSGSDRYVEQYLYDLEADPYELRNLAGLRSHEAVAAAMRERLIRRMLEAGEEAPDRTGSCSGERATPRVRRRSAKLMEYRLQVLRVGRRRDRRTASPYTLTLGGARDRAALRALQGVPPGRTAGIDLGAAPRRARRPPASACRSRYTEHG